jgi:hypothetical protein
MITSCRGSIELTLIVQRGLRKKSWLPRPPQTPWTVGVSLFRITGESEQGFLNDSGSLVVSSPEADSIQPWLNSRTATKSSRVGTTTDTARWGIAASPAALSFIKGRARAKAPYQQDRILAVAQPPKTSVVLRDSGGLTSNRKRHAPIRGEGTSEVG